MAKLIPGENALNQIRELEESWNTNPIARKYMCEMAEEYVAARRAAGEKISFDGTFSGLIRLAENMTKFIKDHKTAAQEDIYRRQLSGEGWSGRVQ